VVELLDMSEGQSNGHRSSARPMRRPAVDRQPARVQPDGVWLVRLAPGRERLAGGREDVQGLGDEHRSGPFCALARRHPCGALPRRLRLMVSAVPSALWLDQGVLASYSPGFLLLTRHGQRGRNGTRGRSQSRTGWAASPPPGGQRGRLALTDHRERLVAGGLTRDTTDGEEVPSDDAPPATGGPGGV
jgi:hypothetical protein